MSQPILSDAGVVESSLVSAGSQGIDVAPEIRIIDFSKVRSKLMEPEPEGKGWSLEVALDAEKWYRRFLHVVLTRPDVRRPVPDHKIDAFWHQHILDTRAYAADCFAVFGRFIHHNPYFGLNGDAAERDACFTMTNQVYREEFGEDLLSARGEDCGAGSCDGGGTCNPCTVDGD